MKNQKKRAVYGESVRVNLPWAASLVRCVVIAGAFAALAACEQPNLKRTLGPEPEPFPSVESLEFINDGIGVIRDGNNKMLNAVQTQMYPPVYEMTGKTDTTDAIFILPEPVSAENLTSVVMIDGQLWGTYTNGVWTWPDPVTPDDPVEPAAAADELPKNALILDTTFAIEIINTNPKVADSLTYTYNVRPYSDNTPSGGGAPTGFITGRITGNFMEALQSSVYFAGPAAGWIAKEVQAFTVNGATRTLVSSTSMSGGLVSGRVFKLPLYNSVVKSTLLCRAVFQKSGAAPHYSPLVPLTEFTGTDEHTIFPAEISKRRANYNWNNTWMLNGADYEVPSAGTISKVILEAAAATTGVVHIGVWRGARAGSQAVKLYDITVNTVVGKNEYDIAALNGGAEWNVVQGDKVGVMISGATTNYLVVTTLNTGENQIGILIKSGNTGGTACTAANFNAAGVGYVFKPKEAANQIDELPVEVAAIPVGGPDMKAGMTAEGILRAISDYNNSYYPLNGTYMLMDDLTLGSSDWVAIGRRDGAGIFTGRFYGQGYTISNIKLSVSGMESHNFVGFFGWTIGPTSEQPVVIRDLNLIVNTDAPLTINNSFDTYLGVALADGASTQMYNVHTRAKDPAKPFELVYTSARLLRMGGLVGQLYGSADPQRNVLQDCSNSVDLKVTATTSNEIQIGGLLGSDNTNATRYWIRSCYNDGNIDVICTTSSGTPWKLVGGLFGKLVSQSSDTRNCYSTGKVTFTQTTPPAVTAINLRQGGLTGELQNGGLYTSYVAGSLIQYGTGSSNNNRTLAGIGNVTSAYGIWNVVASPYAVFEHEYDAGGGRFRAQANNSGSHAAKNLGYNNYVWVKRTNFEGKDINDLNTHFQTITETWVGGIQSGTSTEKKALDSNYNGTGRTLDALKTQATYTALTADWKFDSGNTAEKAGEDWYWKMISGTDYPFPVLWWQAKHLNEADKTGISPTTGRKLQWWETTPPAINEMWPLEDETITIPHEFPEDAH